MTLCLLAVLLLIACNRSEVSRSIQCRMHLVLPRSRKPFIRNWLQCRFTKFSFVQIILDVGLMADWKQALQEDNLKRLMTLVTLDIKPTAMAQGTVTFRKGKSESGGVSTVCSLKLSRIAQLNRMTSGVTKTRPGPTSMPESSRPKKCRLGGHRCIIQVTFIHECKINSNCILNVKLVASYKIFGGRILQQLHSSYCLCLKTNSCWQRATAMATNACEQRINPASYCISFVSECGPASQRSGRWRGIGHCQCARALPCASSSWGGSETLRRITSYKCRG